MKRLAFALLLLPSLASADGIAYRVGKGVQVTPTTAAPTKGSGNALLWVDSTASNVLKYKNPAGVTVTLGAGTGSYNQTIEDEGVVLTQRTNLNFVGAGISCADSGGKTVCTVSSGGSTGNWTFAGDAADDSGAAVLTIGATTATGVTISRTAGTITLAGDTTVSANKGITAAAGTGAFNFGAGTGVFTTSTGTNTISGAMVFAANKGVTVTAGTSAFDFSGGTGTFLTSSGANTLSGTTTLAANKNFVYAAGTGTFDGSASSGAFTTSTGTNTLSGNVVISGSKTFTSGTGTATINGDLQMASGKHVYGGGGVSAADFSAGSGVFKTTTGAATFGGSSNTFTNGLTGPSGGLTVGDSGNISTRTGETNASTFTDFAIEGQSHTTNTDRILFKIDGTTNWSNLLGENSSVLFQLTHNVQFQTGAMATQREFLISKPTYAFVGASTITNAATVAIDGEPTAGTNATITNSYALWVQAGRIAADGGIKLTGSLTGTYNIAGTPTATSPILANLGATTVAPTWTAFTYSNSWVDYGASATSRYTKNALGIVTVEIRCKNGSSPTAAVNSGTPIAAGYRPGQTVQVCGQTLAGGIACGDLDTGGVFSPTVSSTSGIFLRATYFAEN